MSLAGVLVIVLAIAYVAQPTGHIPLYDANLVRLAETQLQGYCAGETFWKTQGAGDAAKARECRAERAGDSSSKIDLTQVESAFCRAIVQSGWEGSETDCLGIMATYQYWPTYDGSITDQWNRARPYPRSALQGAGPGRGDDSRTGGHGGPGRTDVPQRYH